MLYNSFSLKHHELLLYLQNIDSLLLLQLNEHFYHGFSMFAGLSLIEHGLLLHFSEHAAIFKPHRAIYSLFEQRRRIPAALAFSIHKRIAYFLSVRMVFKRFGVRLRIKYNRPVGRNQSK